MTHLQENELFGSENQACQNIQINKNDDFFKYKDGFQLDLHKLGKIIGLKLVFYFGRKDNRIVVLKVGNNYGFKMDAQGVLIEKWLYEHGFIIND